MYSDKRLPPAAGVAGKTVVRRAWLFCHDLYYDFSNYGNARG